VSSKRVADPPAGLPWDGPIDDAVFAFVDLEMTGLGAGDRIIEVCVVRARAGTVLETFESLVRPEGAATAVLGNAHIHGIRAEELEGAPTFAEIAERVSAAFEGAVYVGHGIRYDVAFLAEEMARAGRAFTVSYPIDTLVLTRRAFAFSNHSLDALATHLGIPRGRAHRAADDVAVLREVFVRAVHAIAPATVRDLYETRIGDRKARSALIEKARKAAESGAPVRIRYRPSGRAIETIDLVVTRVEVPLDPPTADVPAAAPGTIVPESPTHLDPPMVFGYLLSSRGRRALRADRILSIESAEDAPLGG
jgi:DNA polymerase-3 subunit epsilon